MGYPGRQAIYTATIRRMVQSSLAQREEDFRRLHDCDSDALLASYLCRCAEELGHTPWEREIVGGKYLRERFGSWENALAYACLPMPNTEDHPRNFRLVREEIETQKRIYREKKDEKRRKSEGTPQSDT